MASYKQSVNMKCAECIYDPCGHGTWRQQVEACTDSSCPLYGVRPLADGKTHTDTFVVPNIVEMRRVETREL